MPSRSFPPFRLSSSVNSHAALIRKKFVQLLLDSLEKSAYILLCSIIK